MTRGSMTLGVTWELRSACYLTWHENGGSADMATRVEIHWLKLLVMMMLVAKWKRVLAVYCGLRFIIRSMTAFRVL